MLLTLANFSSLQCILSVFFLSYIFFLSGHFAFYIIHFLGDFGHPPVSTSHLQGGGAPLHSNEGLVPCGAKINK